ncbi:unnamed protein product [Sphagnum tenellum]
MEGIKEIIVSLMKKLLLNASKAVLGEVLPAGYSRNYVRFLLKETKQQVKVNQEVVKAEMVYPGYQVVIARAVGWEIAASLGNFLGFDKEDIQAPEQRFCVALEAGAGWETSVEVKKDVMGEVAFVLIDYDYLMIRWRFCLDFSHHVKDCPLLIAAKRKEANNNGHRKGVRYALGKEPNKAKKGGDIPSELESNKQGGKFELEPNPKEGTAGDYRLNKEVALEHLKPKVLTADTKEFIEVVNKKKSKGRKGKPPPAWEPMINLIGLVVGYMKA